MMRKSPPKHRHDGTSPLPLGMDWSPAPRKWNGRDTVWPHDPRTGWSYCLTIPSWVPLPRSRDSDPVVFYRVQVGLQSPEGITTTRRVLRRFNHFLKLFTDLKRAFPKKNFPPAPPKGILRIKSRVMLEERRRSLEEWMMKLLSDIDVSRSVSVASFLELEAAARSSFEDIAQQRSEANPSRNDTSPSLDSRPSSSSSVVACGLSLASDYGSDSAYESSDIGTPRLGRDSNSGIGIEDLAMDEESTNPIEKLVKYGISNIDEGLFMGEAILEQLESFPKHKLHGRQINSVMEDTYNGSSSNVALLSGNRMDIFPDPNQSQAASRLQQLSSGSVQSDSSSLKCSDLSDTGIANSPCDGLLHLPEHVDSSSNREPQYAGDAQIVLPIDHRHKLNRVLVSMQRRLVTAKTDMEDVIARLSQEIAVKDYLATKVKDLEVELEATRQKNKETLKQAVFSERERVTRMQWDMEELRRKCMEMELRLKSKQNKKLDSDPTEVFPVEKVGALLPESDDTKEHLENLQKQYTELEIKSKADIKVLVKEVKSLRSTQVQLKQELSQSLKEQSETKEQLKQVKQESEHVKLSWKKLLHDCRNFHRQLQESNFNFLREDGEKLAIDSSSFPDALDLLKTSDKQISLLQSEAQLLAHSGKTVPSADKEQEGGIDTGTMEDESRQLLADIFAEFGRLRERVNAVIRRALETGIEVKKTEREEAPSEHIVLDSKILER